MGSVEFRVQTAADQEAPFEASEVISNILRLDLLDITCST